MLNYQRVYVIIVLINSMAIGWYPHDKPISQPSTLVQLCSNSLHRFGSMTSCGAPGLTEFQEVVDTLTSSIDLHRTWFEQV